MNACVIANVLYCIGGGGLSLFFLANAVSCNLFRAKTRQNYFYPTMLTPPLDMHPKLLPSAETTYDRNAPKLKAITAHTTSEGNNHCCVQLHVEFEYKFPEQVNP
jgi:hypothetical protein